jgi:molecular chaperone DnaJ
MEAMIGCTTEVRGLDGAVFKVTIPPGTQYGAKFGIADQGLYSTNYVGRGRLIVDVDIYIPKNLTGEQIETLRNIKVTL